MKKGNKFETLLNFDFDVILNISMVGSAMRKMKVSKSGLQLQLYTMLYDSNTTVPSNPRYCYSLLSNCLFNLQKGLG